MPLAGNKVFHPRWSEHNRPVATGTQTGTCTIKRETAPGFLDEGTGVWQPPTFAEVYHGPCRITPETSDARYVVAGEERVNTRLYAVAIEWDAAEVKEGDYLTAETATDPRLPGVEMRVMDVRLASEQWERVLRCEHTLPETEV
jgi:hypothetical protein